MKHFDELYTNTIKELQVQWFTTEITVAASSGATVTAQNILIDGLEVICICNTRVDNGYINLSNIYVNSDRYIIINCRNLGTSSITTTVRVQLLYAKY